MTVEHSTLLWSVTMRYDLDELRRRLRARAYFLEVQARIASVHRLCI